MLRVGVAGVRVSAWDGVMGGWFWIMFGAASEEGGPALSLLKLLKLTT